MKRLFFIGIVGHAMRGLAYAAREQGYEVSGLDEAAAIGPGTEWLDAHHITWTKIPNVNLLDGVDTVIISGGTSANDPTTLAAIAKGIRVVSFAEFLGEITAGKHVIAVAGTHGKTTTSSFITWLLESAGRKPDYLIGIQPFNFDSSARLTGSDVVVVEGDEYKASSLDERSKLAFYHPDVLVLTSVEMDHPDVFRDLADIEDRFQAILAALPNEGRLIAWGEDTTVTELASHSNAPVTTYGLKDGAVRARDIAFLPGGIEFDLEVEGTILGHLAVPLFGRHNVLNSLAAASVALGERLSFDDIVKGAATFKGAYRRFNILTSSHSKITVIDDYAHHPTEVATTIEAAKLHYPGKRIIAVFRPHTYSRTQTLLPEIQAAFTQADVAYITDIESARESKQAATVSGADVADGIGEQAIYEPDRTKLVERIIADTKPGDVVLCMTVSGYDGLAGELAEKLNLK